MSKSEGWVKLFDAKKWHYFADNGKSLCGKWMVFTVPKDADQEDDHSENCAECKRKLKKIRGDDGD